MKFCILVWALAWNTPAFCDPGGTVATAPAESFSEIISNAIEQSSVGIFFNKISGIRLLPELLRLAAYNKAWNGVNGRNDAEISAFFANTSDISYRDTLTPRGLHSRIALKSYLTALFQRFPRQVWGIGVRVYPNLLVPGEWAYYYKFEMYESFTPTSSPALSGTGMERATFAPDGSLKLQSDEVHLLFDQDPAAVAEKLKGLQIN